MAQSPAQDVSEIAALYALQDEANYLRAELRRQALILGPLPAPSRVQRWRWRVRVNVQDWRERVALRLAPWLRD